MAGNLLHDTLRASSLDRPDAILAHMPDASVATYGAFFAEAERIAAVLIKAGLQPGDRVAAATRH